MTDQMLRDLLEERVADVTTRDLSGVAWQTGRRARRRDRLVALGAAAVVTAAVSTGVTILAQDGRSTGPSPAPGVPTATSDVEGEPDAMYEGVPVFWSLAQEQELGLPYVETSPLPRVIDLKNGPMVTAMDHAVAAFAVAESVRLVDENGGQLTIDTSRLDDVVKPNGYGYRPFHHSMLSPTGEYLVFPQNDGVEVYKVATGTWRAIDTGDRVTRFVRWLDDDTFVVPPTQAGGLGAAFDVTGEQIDGSRTGLFEPGFDLGQAQAFGPTKTGPRASAQAQSYGMGLPIPVADAGSYISDPEFIAAAAGGETSLLSIMWNIRDQGHGGRFLQCCPVAGWLDDRTLVYESRQTHPAVVAWTVGTDDFALVSTIEGQYVLASFADLG